MRLKVLWVGAWRDHTGWGRASLDYIMALDAAGVDVVPRAIKLNGRREPLPERILELEAKPTAGFDAVIQHILPHMMSYDKRCGRNIGLFASETSHFRGTSWADRLNMMDEVWVINAQQVDACKKSGVKRPIRVVPHACDPTAFDKAYPPFPSLPDGFKFYSVGEAVRRKNLAALLKAFHLEFSPSEPVELVLKCDWPGAGPQEGEAHLRNFCEEIAKGLKVKDRKPEHIVSGRLSEEGMMALHASCDCFVQPSYGEAWSLTAFAAMGMGKTPIVTACTGYLDYIDDKVGYLVDCRPEPCFGAMDTFDDLHTGLEEWWSADILHLRKCMRTAFEARNDRYRGEKAAQGRQRAERYSHLEIGRLMSSYLREGAGDEGRAVLAGIPGTGPREASQGTG